MHCDYKDKGCTWGGKFRERDDHLKECEYNSTQCELCGQTIAASTAEDHKLRLCKNAVIDCPYQILGCSNKNQLPKSDMEMHLHENEIEHAKHVVKSVCKIENEAKETRQKVNELAFQVDMLASQSQPEDLGYGTLPESESRIQADSAGFTKPRKNRPKKGTRIECDCGDPECSDDGDTPSVVTPNRKGGPRVVADGVDVEPVERDGPTGVFAKSKPEIHLRLENEMDTVPQMLPGFRGGFDPKIDMKKMLQPFLDQFQGKFKEEMLMTMRADMDSKASGDSRRKDAEITALKDKVLQLEKTVRTKTTEAEDRDFRLSLIENSNYEGNMVWKIPQFSQRKADAESGKYTSIFSLPFYTGRYGYKMCLRLYILGDGIGKNTHMSLFFVVMRGEFDNILQWPFTHKVTFKLINQKGARDVVDTFQPDPMSSSFRKPKSDMNIASGCPRFVSHQELQNGGFIEDDTIFIKCIIDKNTIHHP